MREFNKGLDLDLEFQVDSRSNLDLADLDLEKNVPSVIRSTFIRKYLIAPDRSTISFSVAFYCR